MPKYVGQTGRDVFDEFNQHVTAALDRMPGDLNDWIRAVWARGHEVEAYQIQEGITAKDVDMFEYYWRDQFAELVTVSGSQPGKTNTAYADQITSAIQMRLGLVSLGDQGD